MVAIFEAPDDAVGGTFTPSAWDAKEDLRTRTLKRLQSLAYRELVETHWASRLNYQERCGVEVSSCNLPSG